MSEGKITSSTAPAPADGAVGVQDRKPVRTKRPRPCFDDGALTRVFKFPSKTFPRSSYYVTSTEIIIRIKKARKKWKLVVPKKRLVSYRTNRWFAKPRWVEIELTFTQAVKLGLVEPRPAPKEADSAQLAIMPAAAEPDPADAAGPRIADDAVATVSVSTDDVEATNEGGVAIEVTADDVEETAAPEAFAADNRFAAEPDVEPDADAAEDFGSFEEPGHGFAADANDEDVLEQPVREGLLSVADGAARFEPPPVIAAAAARNGSTAGRAGAALMATLALGLAGVSGHLLMRGEPATPGLASGPACAAPGEAGQCTQDFVTGSIDRGVRQELKPREPVDAPADVAATEGVMLPGTAFVSERAARSDERLETERGEASMNVAVARPDDAGKVAQDVPEMPAAEPPAAEPLLPASNAVCGELASAARAIRIQFDYASWAVDRGVMSALGQFAERLQSCPSVRVLIEGHTDGDGHAERNQVLSLRRADAVRELLVEAGAKPDQIMAIGCGQTRPQVPNVSAENKRRNRRAAMVVESIGDAK